MMILLSYYCTPLSATGGILDSQGMIGMMVDNNTMGRIFALENITVNPNLVIMIGRIYYQNEITNSTKNSTW